MNVNIAYAVILPFHDFHLRGQTDVYVSKHPFRQDIFKQTYRNVVFRDYILNLALYTVKYIREFKNRWYQIYKADYCVKHFKLVFTLFDPIKNIFAF